MKINLAGHYEQGPSPRVRGKPARSSHRIQWLGSIPACAGETCPRSRSFTRGRVHPRVCGGNPINGGAMTDAMGPSPRVRGKRFDGERTISGTGSIPACAGETRARSRLRRMAGVHPRVCGGNVRTAAWLRLRQGPSPRVRGKRTAQGSEAREGGSIPACAGETVVGDALLEMLEVHPRVCGGNAVRADQEGEPEGPSPRVRGKLLYMVYVHGVIHRMSVRQPAPDDI